MKRNNAKKFLSRKFGWNKFGWNKFRCNKLVRTKPTIETYCEVYDTNVPWYRRKQIIWRETKPFEFAYWIDVSGPDTSMEPRRHLMVTYDFKIDFADDETEKKFEEHVKEMLEELPEYCRNAERVVKIIKKVGEKEHIFYHETTRIKFGFMIFMFPISIFTLYFMFQKEIYKMFWKRVTIKKLISNKTMEVKL